MNKDINSLEQAGKLTQDEAISKRGQKIVNDTKESCGFCITIGDKYCICHQKIKREMLIDLISKK